jgi:hypothetical protein
MEALSDNLAKFLKDNEEPQFTKFRMLVAEPILEYERRDIELPKWHHVITDMEITEPN